LRVPEWEGRSGRRHCAKQRTSTSLVTSAKRGVATKPPASRMASVLESDVSHSSATATMERPHRAEDRREALAAARGWRGAEKDVEDAGDGLSAGALLVEGLAEQAGDAILRFGPPIAA